MRKPILGRWDARCRLTGLLAFAAAAASARTPAAAGVCCAIALLFLSLAAVTLRGIAARIGLILLGLAPFAIAIPFVAEHPFEQTATVLLRGLAVGLTGFALYAAAPPAETFAAAAALRVPGPVVLVARLAERYSGLFFAEFRRGRRAAVARGFGGRSPAVYGHLIGGVFARGLQRADAVAAAMAARGFDGRYRGGPEFRLRAGDIIVLSVVLVAAGSVLAFEWMR